jgi:hypothetical protein
LDVGGGVGVGVGVGDGGATPSWVTVYVCPPTITRPERAAPALAETESETVAGPLPLRPPVTAIQASAGVAVQLQPVCVDSATLSPPPATPMLLPPLASVNRHGAAAWLSWIVVDAIASVPERGLGRLFAATT